MHPAHGDVLALLGAAVTSFLATNLDALAILAPMLWSTRPGRRRYPVLIGCSVGNAAVLALALLTAAGLEVVPEDQLRWVGVVPIVMGVYRLVPRRGAGGRRARGGGAAGRPDCAADLVRGDVGFSSSAFVDTGSGKIPAILIDAGDGDGDGAGPVAVLDAGAAIATGGEPSEVFELSESSEPAGPAGPSEPAGPAGPAGPRAGRGATKALFAHAGLTVALGGDNIAVLAPLFRALGTGGSALIATTHLILFPLLLALPVLANRSGAEVPRLARPASACLSIVIGTVIVAG